jgi:hypothetical protein
MTGQITLLTAQAHIDDSRRNAGRRRFARQARSSTS